MDFFGSFAKNFSKSEFQQDVFSDQNDVKLHEKKE